MSFWTKEIIKKKKSSHVDDWALTGLGLGRSGHLGLTCLWTMHIAHSSHRWWSSLVLLDLSCQEIFYGTGGVMVGVSVYL